MLDPLLSLISFMDMFQMRFRLRNTNRDTDWVLNKNKYRNDGKVKLKSALVALKLHYIRHIGKLLSTTKIYLRNRKQN